MWGSRNAWYYLKQYLDMKLFYKDDQEERIDNECKLIFIYCWDSISLYANRSLNQIIWLSTVKCRNFSFLCWLIMLMTFDDEMYFKVYVKPHFNVWENVAKQRHCNLLQLDKYEFMWMYICNITYMIIYIFM